jgi:ATP-dependent helicase/nuclease subunit B
MEASIGLRTSEAGTLLDSVDPVRLPLGGGKSIRIRGRIDRIDRIGDPQGHAFALWDYKTGSTWRFRQEPPFWQGRVLQHAVYLHLALDRLRQIHPKADVKEVGYFFPSRRGRGERLTHTPQELGEGLAILQRLCRLVGDGAFLATDNTEEDCTYCDYVDICGDLTAVSQASQRKLQGTDKLLDPLRELRGYDEQE